MRYYSTQRPIVPGSVPGDGLTGIHNFDDKTYCPAIEREAWGFAEYDHALTAADVERYELVQDGMRIWWSVISADKGGKRTAHLGPITEALERPVSHSTRKDDNVTILQWVSSREAAERLVDDLRT